MRLVKCNSLDLSLFQFDYDLTFAVFFLNADRTIYARYGTRSAQDAETDVALDGLAATMREVLEIHRGYPDNATTLSGKQPGKTDKPVPEAYAMLDHFKPELDYQGAVAKSCIHCHQIRDAQRFELRARSEPWPEDLLLPYPLPVGVGIKLDPRTRSTIESVAAESLAERAGLLAGDAIITVDGTNIASASDLQWMLHQASDKRMLSMVVDRSSKYVELELELPTGWRESATDLSWRPTSWDLRRMATGGIILTPLSNAERSEMEFEDGKMALRVTHVGQYGEHARAKRAGIRKGDIIIAIDEQENLTTESAVFEYATQQKMAGEGMMFTYQRNGRTKIATITLR